MRLDVRFVAVGCCHVDIRPSELVVLLRLVLGNAPWMDWNFWGLVASAGGSDLMARTYRSQETFAQYVVSDLFFGLGSSISRMETLAGVSGLAVAVIDCAWSCDRSDARTRCAATNSRRASGWEIGLVFQTYQSHGDA